MTEDIREQLDLPDLNQVGFVVRDMAAALALYDYRGQEEECDMRLAFGKSGDVEIELIEWVRGGCPHKEFLDAGREGMHHLRFIVDDLDAKVAEAGAIGYRSIWGKRYGEGLAVAYLEREGDPLLLEFFENHHG